MLELKEVGESGLCGGGVIGMGTSRGLGLPVKAGGIGGGASRGESRDTTLLPPNRLVLELELEEERLVPPYRECNQQDRGVRSESRMP